MSLDSFENVLYSSVVFLHLSILLSNHVKALFIMTYYSHLDNLKYMILNKELTNFKV